MIDGGSLQAGKSKLAKNLPKEVFVMIELLQSNNVAKHFFLLTVEFKGLQAQFRRRLNDRGSAQVLLIGLQLPLFLFLKLIKLDYLLLVTRPGAARSSASHHCN